MAQMKTPWRLYHREKTLFLNSVVEVATAILPLSGIPNSHGTVTRI